MSTLTKITLFVIVSVLAIGCEKQSPPGKTGAESRSKTPGTREVDRNRPQFRATVVHFSSGSQGRITSTHEIGRDRGGFAGNTSHLTTPDGKKRFIGKFEIRFVEHRDGKDIYSVMRKVATNDEGTSTSMTQKQIAFAGETIVVFKDKHGSLSIVPRKQSKPPVNVSKPGKLHFLTSRNRRIQRILTFGAEASVRFKWHVNTAIRGVARQPDSF